MADLIKKIKIKKQDGTFTDYIPIGADAANVETSDGESVQLKLNKKPYYYTNVASMKADIKLKAGDMAITLGYYEANNGGGAEYQIVNDNTLVDDGGSVHELDNGLKAKLVIKNSINAKQFGAYGDGIHDDTIMIKKALGMSGDIYFDGGVYLISEELKVNTQRIKSITLVPNATIKAIASIESIITLEQNNSTNFIIIGGKLDCNSLAKRGIYANAIIFSPTFKQIFIKDATEAGIELTNNQAFSCHGYLSDLKIYNPNTLATGMIFSVHDMQIDDCEIFYTNLGIDFKKAMHTMNNVHIWAGGELNNNANTVGIKYAGPEVLNLDSIYFDGMNTCINADQGFVNMQNMIFYYPSEGTYDKPVCLYGHLYTTHWNLGLYFLKSVVATALMEYKNFDADNIVTNNKSIFNYSYNQKQLFEQGIIDLGYNSNFMVQKEIAVMLAYKNTYKNNKDFLIGYYVLPASQKQCEIELAFEQCEIGINQEIYCNFTYSGGQNGTISINKIHNNIKDGGRNTSFCILFGKPISTTTIREHSLKVIPIYFRYLNSTSGYISSRDLIVRNLRKQTPGCITLFEAIEKDIIQDNEILIKYFSDGYFKNVLNSEESITCHLMKKSNYKLIIVNYGNGRVLNQFAEYIITTSNINLEFLQTSYSSTFTLPTFSKDENEMSITITAPSGQWYFIELQEM